MENEMLEQKVVELENKVNSLQETIDKLHYELSQLESRVYAMHMNY